MDPDVVDVFPGSDGVGNVRLGDDAGRLAGLRVSDDQGGGAGVLHQIGGRSHVVVLRDRRQRWAHDVGDRGRG
jgi:hypothetical protein